MRFQNLSSELNYPSDHLRLLNLIGLGYNFPRFSAVETHIASEAGWWLRWLRQRQCLRDSRRWRYVAISTTSPIPSASCISHSQNQ